MSTRGGTSARLVGVLSFVFFMSGFASLLYRVAWQRLLTLHYVVRAISNVLIVRVYMLGLGFGGLAGGHPAQLAVLAGLSSKQRERSWRAASPFWEMRSQCGRPCRHSR